MSTTEIYTLSLHDALPISLARQARIQGNVVLHAIIDKDGRVGELQVISGHPLLVQDRKSTRLNSSHPSISYAVFCLKKKKKKKSRSTIIVSIMNFSTIVIN